MINFILVSLRVHLNIYHFGLLLLIVVVPIISIIKFKTKDVIFTREFGQPIITIQYYMLGKLKAAEKTMIRQMMADRNNSPNDIAKRFGVSRSTVYSMAKGVTLSPPIKN